MIIFRPAFLSKKRAQTSLKPKIATAALSSGEEQSHNSDDSDADSEKVRKAKKSRKLAYEKWSGSLMCKLIDEYKARPRL